MSFHEFNNNHSSWLAVETYMEKITSWRLISMRFNIYLRRNKELKKGRLTRKVWEGPLTLNSQEHVLLSITSFTCRAHGIKCGKK